MKQALLVFLGGGFGSVLRYFLGKWLNNLESALPYGTFLVNVVGSFLIGLALGYLAKTTTVSENYSLILAVGFCGGFTTFSAFAYENYLFLKHGDYLSFFTYTFVSIVLGLLAVFLGLYSSKLL